MNFRKLLPLLLSTLLISSCETDFDLNAEWKDITIVYGLLNQNDSIHYIRVQKAFLGEGNTLHMALEPDSNIYKGKLEVVMEEWSGSNRLRQIKLDTISIHEKEDGVFFNPTQPLFYTTETINPNYLYKLLITNKETDKLISSETRLINDFSITRPAANTQINFQVVGSNTRTFVWKHTPNAGRYQMILRFNYVDVNQNTGDTIPRFVDWNSQIIKVSNVSGSNDIEVSFLNETFFTMVETRVPKLDNVLRYPVNVEIIVHAAAKEFSTYIDVNEPTSSLIQEKPEYTNIENGLGIFSARYNKSSVHRLHFQTINRLMELEGYNFQWIP